MRPVILVVMILYCIFVIGLGIYCGVKDKSDDAFKLGGRKIPGWALALSERATCESAFMLIGVPGVAYATGVSAIWLCAFAFVGICVSWIVMARRFVKETDKYNTISLIDLISTKHSRYGKQIRWVGTIIVACFFFFYIAAQFSGAGKTLYTVFGMDIKVGMVLTAIIVTVYCMLGGFNAVVWTDVVQSLLMVFALVILPIIAFITLKSRGVPIVETLRSYDTTYVDLWGGLTGVALGIFLMDNFSWFFGYLGGMPHLSCRFMAIKNEAEIKNSGRTAIVWSACAILGATALGVLGIALYGPGAVEDSEMIMPYMAMDLLPEWLAGILLSGIIAAIMSTADSQMLVICTSISEDLAHKAMGKTFTQKQMIRLSRLVILGAGIAGFAVSQVAPNVVTIVTGWAWAGLGSTFTACVLCSFFWRKTSSAGILAGIIAGAAGTVIWMSTPFDAVLSARFTTFFFALIAVVIVSCLVPEKMEAEAGKE